MGKKKMNGMSMNRNKPQYCVMGGRGRAWREKKKRYESRHHGGKFKGRGRWVEKDKSREFKVRVPTFRVAPNTDLAKC